MSNLFISSQQKSGYETKNGFNNNDSNPFDIFGYVDSPTSVLFWSTYSSYGDISAAFCHGHQNNNEDENHNPMRNPLKKNYRYVLASPGILGQDWVWRLFYIYIEVFQIYIFMYI